MGARKLKTRESKEKELKIRQHLRPTNSLSPPNLEKVILDKREKKKQRNNKQTTNTAWKQKEIRRD